jgi:hypothetical protein
VSIESLPLEGGVAVVDAEGTGEDGPGTGEEACGVGLVEGPPGAGSELDGVGLGAAGADDEGGLDDGDALDCAEADTWVVARRAAPASCNASTVRASLLIETSGGGAAYRAR